MVNRGINELLRALSPFKHFEVYFQNENVKGSNTQKRTEMLMNFKKI